MHIVDRAIRVCEVSKVVDTLVAGVCVAALFAFEERWATIVSAFFLGACTISYLLSGIIRQHLITNRNLLETNADLIKLVKQYRGEI